MALQTIVEGDKYSRTQLLAGVVEEIVDASPMFAFLPFDTVLGNSLTYNRENTLGTAQFYDPGEVWVESTPTVTAVTAKLKIAGGDADLDDFLALTRSNEQDLRATMLSMKVKALVRSIENELIYGDVDEINALVKPGPPDALIMSRRSRRQIKKLARSQGWDLALNTPQGLNRPINFYNDIPIFINDFITDTEDCVDGGFGGKTGDDTSSIFAVKFGAEGLHGIDGGQGIIIEDVGALETKDASRIRVKWYMSLVLMSTKALARLSGVDTQDWTN